jgi:transposase
MQQTTAESKALRLANIRQNSRLLTKFRLLENWRVLRNAERKPFGGHPDAERPLASDSLDITVKRIDAVFDVEREIVGKSASERLRVRQERSVDLVEALLTWMRGERAKLSRHSEVAKAIDYMLKRWPAFTRFLEDGRICLTNNAAERALRGLAGA